MANKVLTLIKDGEVVERTCLSCKVMKPLSDYQKDIHGYLQKKARCRECCNKKWRDIDYHKNKRSTISERPDKLRRVYGTNWENVVKTLNNQMGFCANRGCGKKISFEANKGTANRAVIDHCHKTGKFRAVLCSPCNLTLGRIEDNKNLIMGLLEYSTKYEQINEQEDS